MELPRTVCELQRWRRRDGRLEDARVLGVARAARRGRCAGAAGQALGLRGRCVQACSPDGGVRAGVRAGRQRARHRAAGVRAGGRARRAPAAPGVDGRLPLSGARVPFGAQLRYLELASRPARAVVGYLQFSSPAWRTAARDRWVGCDDGTRARDVQHVVNNSRFLLLPWVTVRNLASAVLSRGLSQMVADTPRRYRRDQWLVETLVDPRRHHGGCCCAGNWVALGATTGQGRMDRLCRRVGEALKTVLVYGVVRGCEAAAAGG